MNFLIIVVNLLISSFLVQSEWELKKDKNGIKVFLRSNSSEVQEYLAETIIESDLKSISKIILDFDQSYKWMYKLKSSKILDKNLSYNSYNKGNFLSVKSLNQKIKANLKSFEK